MQPPCEVMVDYFLPPMRGIVAHELAERGHTQSKIASELGITQARVSHYLSNRKSVYYNDLADHFGKSEAELEGFARILSDDVSRSQVDGIFTLYSIWKNMLFNGDVCGFHQRRSGITKDCSVCMDLHRPPQEASITKVAKDEDFAILRTLSEAVAQIESLPLFPAIMPEVSVNIAMCRINPKSKRDVAAIPGRINKFHGRAKAFVLPEFGSSNHMSKVLLLFNSKSNHVRSVINLRYDESLDRALSRVGLRTIITKERTIPQRKGEHSLEVPLSNDETVLRRLAGVMLPQAFLKDTAAFAVIDLGSEGLEPITYLFGTTANELSQLAMKLCYSYSEITQSAAAKLS
jgi:XRE family transcriptional regulator, thiamine biosynthesis regulator